MADPFHMVFDVWQTVEEVLGRYLPQADLVATSDLLADRAGAALPRIVVFGTYNAGKSTLINALTGLSGEEAAPVADHPKTDRVQSYSWNGYILDDTPGIDAPIEHEKVTREHLKSADAVMFVLATDGTLEEGRSYDEIVALVEDGKPVRLVLNNKHAYDVGGEQLRDLTGKMTDNLRNAAAEAGIGNIEELVPIRVVNAAAALRGRLPGKQKLLEYSGIIGLEQDLQSLCQNTDRVQMARTVGRGIERLIEQALSLIPGDETLRPLHEINDVVAVARARIEEALDSAISQTANRFRGALRNDVRNQVAKPGEAALEEAADTVNAILERELGKVQLTFTAQGIDVDVALAAARALKVPALNLAHELGVDEEAETENEGGWAAKGVIPVLQQLRPGYSEVEREAVVNGLLVAKKFAPDLFKGIGVKTFEKAAAVVGPAIQLGMSAYQTFDAYNREQRAAEREKEARLAMEQEIADAAGKLRWALEQQYQNVMHAVFAPVEIDLARRMAGLKGDTARSAQDQALLTLNRARLSLL